MNSEERSELFEKLSEVSSKFMEPCQAAMNEAHDDAKQKEIFINALIHIVILSKMHGRLLFDLYLEAMDGVKEFEHISCALSKKKRAKLQKHAQRSLRKVAYAFDQKFRVLRYWEHMTVDVFQVKLPVQRIETALNDPQNPLFPYLQNEDVASIMWAVENHPSIHLSIREFFPEFYNPASVITTIRAMLQQKSEVKEIGRQNIRNNI